MLVAVACGDENQKPPVEDPAAVRILSFEVNPREVSGVGEVVSISWKTSGATNLEVFANDRAVDLESQEPSAGSLSFAMEETTSFRLVAKAGPRTAESQTIEVRVQDQVEELAIVSFQADPVEIEPGDSTTLSWATRNAESVQIIDGGGKPVDLQGQAAADGSVAVLPGASTTYTLIAERGAERVEKLASVNVRPGPDLAIAYFRAREQTPVPIGGKVLLEWDVLGNPESITVSNEEGELHEVEEHRGSLEVTMGSGGRFQLVAKKGVGAVSQDATVPLLRAPSIGRFYPLQHAATLPAGTVRLEWSGVERAASLTLVGDTVGEVSLAGSDESEGFVDVVIAADTTFTLVAANAAGEDTADAFVRMVPPASISYLKATPKRVGPAETFTLSWKTLDAKSVTVETVDGPLDNVSDGMIGEASVQRQILEDTEFILRAINEAGDFLEERLLVTVGPPDILSFAVTPTFAAPGQTLTAAWQILGGTSLSLAGTLGEVCSTISIEEIEDGSCTFTAGEEGLHAYELLVVNGVSQETLGSADVLVGAGPHIVSFAASPEEMTAGSAVTFTWEVDDDPLGLAADLHLTDGTTVYDLEGADPNSGSEQFVLADAGTYDFVFTASTVNGTKTAFAQVQVFGAPGATLLASSPVYDGAAPITLSWTSQNADMALVLHEVDASGGVILPALLTVPVAERGSGSFDVEPTRDTTYRIVATNGLGAFATAETSVNLAPPQILTFEATPPEVVAGDDVTLSWTTRLADGVRLSVVLDQPTPAEVVDPFVDISATGTALTLTGRCGHYEDIFGNPGSYPPEDEGCATIDFPAGFTFPFDGDVHTSIEVYANGVVGFDPTYTQTTWANYPLPASFRPAVSLAPFWEDLDFVDTSYSFGNDSEGSFLVIQWTGALSPFFLPNLTSSLEFQAVLRTDGSFSFRYGTMMASSQGLADGSSATIGYQALQGGFSEIVHVGGQEDFIGNPIAGGLSNRSWRFSYPPGLASDGDYTFTPSSSGSVTLTAYGNGQVSDAIDIVVHPRALLSVVPPVEEVQGGWPFDIGWTTQHASAVEILDASGVRCTAAPAELAAGACALTEAAPGIYSYTVRATGALGHQVEEELDVEVFAPFVLEEFVADNDSIHFGQDVTLSWSTHGAAVITLEVDGVDVLLPGAPVAQGSYTDSPTTKTTYVFTATALDGRTRTISRTVEVRTFTFDLQADKTSVAPGTPVTLSWNVTSLTGTSPTVLISNSPMVEADASPGSQHEFFDISSTGTNLGISDDDEYAVVDFSATGFTFPFDGAVFDAIQVSEQGFISFDLGSIAWLFDNVPFSGSTSGDKAKVHLAPNWGDILMVASSGVYSQFISSPGNDHWIIQWDKMHHYQGSQEMSFQVVLFADGSFEYRYGTMDPTSDPLSNGQRKTIGYQTPSGDFWQLHYGGGWLSSTGLAEVPGGLAHRTWRSAPMQGNSSTIIPPKTTDVLVCVSLSGFTECKTVRVIVVQEGDVLITELMVDPALGHSAWFEVRNLLEEDLELEGWTLTTTAGSHTIVGSLLVPPGEYMTLSAGPANGFQEDYDFGSSLLLNPQSDSLSLGLSAMTIARVAWDSTWTISSGQSRELSLSSQQREAAILAEEDLFCSPTSSYDGGTSFGTPGLAGQSCTP